MYNVEFIYMSILTVAGFRRMGLDQRLQLMEMELQNLRQRNGGTMGVLADGLW